MCSVGPVGAAASSASGQAPASSLAAEPPAAAAADPAQVRDPARATILPGPWRGVARRFAAGCQRRARRAWHLLTQGERPPAAEAALGWLLDQGRAGRIAPSGGSSAPCPGLTAACVETLAAYGEREAALAWAQWLMGLQRPDGSLPDAGLAHASLMNTALGARGFAAVAEQSSLAATAWRRAAMYLASRVDLRGMVHPAEGSASFDRWAPPLVHLCVAPPLLTAAERWGCGAWAAAARRALHHAEAAVDLRGPGVPLHVTTHGLEALLDAGRADLAVPLVNLALARQRRDGAVSAEFAVRWVSTAGLAHLAALAFRIGRRAEGNRALAWLARRQQPTGGFLGSYGPRAGYYPRRTAAWTARHFLVAAQRQVEAAFATTDPGEHEPLDPRDGRLDAVRQWLATLPAGARVADVGCGAGRYVRRLAAEFSQLRFLAIDPSRALLDRLPQGIQRAAGTLLRLPLEDAALDAAFAVESLEHSLNPARAVAELARVTRPGGKLLVIDKDRGQQGHSLHEPWERWFTPDEVAGWLAPWCDAVGSTGLAHVDRGRLRTGLFLAWRGTRRAAGEVRRAA